MLPISISLPASGALLALLLAGCAQPTLRPDLGVTETSFLLWSSGRVTRVDPGSAERASFLQLAGKAGTSTDPGVEWRIDYRDVRARKGRGFDDPAQGAARRKALEESLAFAGSMLGVESPVVIDVTVEESLDEAISMLAHAGTFYPSVAPGIYKGHAAVHIQSGFDPDPAMVDIAMQFNFRHRFHTAASAPLPNTFDLRSVVIHELTHALGMASMLGPDGTNRVTNTNPGPYTSYDRLVAGRSASSLVDASGRFVGSAPDVNGTAGELTWLGARSADALRRRPRLFTPLPYEEGSSVSHWSRSDPPAVMHPSIVAGTQRRYYSPVEIGMLRDLGYANARLPTSTAFDFEPALVYPATAQVASALILDFDDRPGLDLLVLENGPAGSVLRVHSDLNPANPYFYKLPMAFGQMNGDLVGPRAMRGIVLGSYSQGTLLSLGGLKVPTDRSELAKSDFQHVHTVAGPYSNLPTDENLEGRLATAELDNFGGADYLTLSARHGFVPYLRDQHGYFDSFGQSRSLIELPLDPLLDLTAYETGNGFGLDIPFGLFVNPDIATYVERPGQLTRRLRLDRYDNYRVNRLARYGIIGFAALSGLGETKQQLARIRIENQDYRIEQRWADLSDISDIKIVEGPLEAVFITADHTLHKLGATAQQYQRLSGSAPGHRDGPLGQALFHSPQSMCVQGRTIYVVDAANFVLRRVDLMSGEVTTLAGTRGAEGDRDGLPGEGKFRFGSRASGAHACAVMGDSLYVLDGSAAGPTFFRKVNLNNGYVTTVPEDLNKFGTVRNLAVHGKHLFFLSHLAESDGSRRRRVEIASTFEYTTPAPSALPLIRLAYFDEDAQIDAVAMLGTAFRALNIYRGVGNGSFKYVEQHLLDTSPLNVEVADVDIDGNVDLVATTDRGVRVLRGMGNGRFEPDLSRSLVVRRPVAWSQLRDFDGDGRPDLVLLLLDGSLLIYIADNQGRWGGGPGEHGENHAALLDTADSTPIWFEIVNLDNDSHFDVLTRSRSLEVRLHRGRAPR